MEQWHEELVFVGGIIYIYICTYECIEVVNIWMIIGINFCSCKLILGSLIWLCCYGGVFDYMLCWLKFQTFWHQNSDKVQVYNMSLYFIIPLSSGFFVWGFRLRRSVLDMLLLFQNICFLFVRFSGFSLPIVYL